MTCSTDGGAKRDALKDVVDVELSFLDGSSNTLLDSAVCQRAVRKRKLKLRNKTF
jgi:hypothetical protein